MVNIQDDYAAYCFDEAIGYFGNYVKGELDDVDGKSKAEIEGKRKLVLAKIFDEFEPDDVQEASGFRDPMDVLGQKAQKQ